MKIIWGSDQQTAPDHGQQYTAGSEVQEKQKGQAVQDIAATAGSLVNLQQMEDSK